MLGEKCAGKVRLSVRRHDHGQRPAVAAAQILGHAHVDRVNVRTFFSIDLDADKVTVQQGADLLVFETLDLHDVAPVTGGVADGEEDGFAFGLGPGKRFLAPGEPVDRVVCVLEQIGTLLLHQAIRVPVSARGLSRGAQRQEYEYRYPDL